MTPYSQGLVDIGRLAFKFAQVNRVTLRDDGEYESDTDHTVMLSICACALAEALYKEKLDLGKVAQFAIVHDLVEAHVGDTNTINLPQDKREEKEWREKQSLERIEQDFKGVYPWIHETIAEYERKESPEARFVKTLDKAMTKITNIINGGAAIKKLGTTYEEIELFFENQMKEYKNKYGDEFPELIEILDELMKNMLQEMYAKLH